MWHRDVHRLNTSECCSSHLETLTYNWHYLATWRKIRASDCGALTLANTLTLKHDSKRCFIPDHGVFPITDLRNEKNKSLHQKKTLDHLLSQSRRKHLQPETTKITRIIHVPTWKDNALSTWSRPQLGHFDNALSFQVGT